MQKIWLSAYEQGVPPSLEIPDLTLPKLLFNAFRRFPRKPALIFFGRSITYEELDRETNRFANALIGLGVRKGDRVALMLPNLPQYVIGCFGTLKVGAIVVQTNPLYVERELEIQLNDCGAETLVALDLFYPKILNIRHKTPLKRIILARVSDYLPWYLRVVYPLKAIREGQRVSVAIKPPLYEFKSLVKQADPTEPIVAGRPEDTALLQYTGGTTGIPKGVMLSHNNLVANVYQCRRWMPSLREGEEVFLGVIPFFHVYGMSTCMNLSILTGGSLVLLPKFSTAEVLNTVVRHRVTLFMGVQAMYVAINNFSGIGKFDLSSIRICISGAGPLDVDVQERFEELTGGKLVEGYGLSEASPVTHCTPIHGLRKKGSIGLPLPGTDVRIIDPADPGRERESGEVGELWVRGPQVMQGYWNHPEETRLVLTDRWLRTGDMVLMDENGYFFVVGRKKEMIKTRGENVYPREIEEAILRHPGVDEAVVAGLPESFGGERIKAYVVLKPGEAATESELVDFLKGELAPFKVPKEVEFRKELPKTFIGKVLRRVLVEEELQKAAASPVQGTGPSVRKEHA